MELVLPRNYVEIEQEEMMYLDGGWSTKQVLKNLTGLAAVAGMAGVAKHIKTVIKNKPGIGFWALVAKTGTSAKAAFILLPTWAKVGTLGLGAAVIYALGTWDIF